MSGEPTRQLNLLPISCGSAGSCFLPTLLGASSRCFSSVWRTRVCQQVEAWHGFGCCQGYQGHLCPCKVLESMKAQASQPGSGVLTPWEPPPKGLTSTESGSLVTQLPLSLSLSLPCSLNTQEGFVLLWFWPSSPEVPPPLLCLLTWFSPNRLYLGNPMDPPDLLSVELSTSRPTQHLGRLKSKSPPMPWSSQFTGHPEPALLL